MASWRDKILREFLPQIARLTLVADPDGLLLEEGIFEEMRARGFELIPFDDNVAFRYIYESKFRSRWDNGEEADSMAVLRLASSELDLLPYDLLQAGRKVSVSLSDLFPNLSYPVIATLDFIYLDTLFQAQEKFLPGRLGDNATKGFILRSVFEIIPEFIKEPKDLLLVLLRRHYRGIRIPSIIDEYFIQLLQQNEMFKEWPLGAIVPDR
ncbi:MAG TPA: BREX-3 system phosphatase PglZ, partial [Acetomicrobium sp.]|nr:BREX-3 system phosphatase PglZ [Acetomicrobium sp.]